MEKDIKDMTNEEFQQYWLDLAKKDAETNPYDAELLDMITRIIDTKDYSNLFYSFRAYDRVVKALEKNRITDIPKIEEWDMPFWANCFGFNTCDCNQEEVGNCKGENS